jgi:hypothetical protein
MKTLPSSAEVSTHSDGISADEPMWDTAAHHAEDLECQGPDAGHTHHLGGRRDADEARGGDGQVQGRGHSSPGPARGADGAPDRSSRGTRKDRQVRVTLKLDADRDALDKVLLMFVSDFAVMAADVRLAAVHEPTRKAA